MNSDNRKTGEHSNESLPSTSKKRMEDFQTTDSSNKKSKKECNPTGNEETYKGTNASVSLHSKSNVGAWTIPLLLRLFHLYNNNRLANFELKLHKNSTGEFDDIVLSTETCSGIKEGMYIHSNRLKDKTTSNITNTAEWQSNLSFILQNCLKSFSRIKDLSIDSFSFIIISQEKFDNQLLKNDFTTEIHDCSITLYLIMEAIGGQFYKLFYPNEKRTLMAAFQQINDDQLEKKIKNLFVIFGVLSGVRLDYKNFNLLPSWVTKPAETIKLLQNKLRTKGSIDIKSLKKFFRENKSNKNYTDLKASSQERFEYVNKFAKHSQSNSIELDLGDIINKMDDSYISAFESTSDMQTVLRNWSQSKDSKKIECLVVDTTSTRYTMNNLGDILCEIIKYLFDVGLNESTIITVVGSLYTDHLEQIEEYAEEYKVKVVIIEEKNVPESSKNLTVDTKEPLLKQLGESSTDTGETDPEQQEQVQQPKSFTPSEYGFDCEAATDNLKQIEEHAEVKVDIIEEKGEVDSPKDITTDTKEPFIKMVDKSSSSTSKTSSKQQKQLQQHPSCSAAYYDIESEVASTSSKITTRYTTHGFDYQSELSLTVALSCFHLVCNGLLSDFYITLENPNSGHVDDVVLRYKEDSKNDEFIFFFQAKYKQTEINPNPIQQSSHNIQDSTKCDSGNQQELISKENEIKKNEEWFQKKFHLFVEFCVSLIETYNNSCTDSSMFAICTNEQFDEQILNKYFVETIPKNNATFNAIVKELGGNCYKLNSSDVIQISQNVLCKTLAYYIKNQKQITDMVPIFKMCKHYIAQLVENSESGKFFLKKKLCGLKAPYESGTPWESFTNEYKSLLIKEEIATLNWKTIEINISNSFFPKDTSSKPSTISDDDIVKFFDCFYIITGTQNNLMLGDTNMSLMPSWVSDKTEIYGSYFTQFFKEVGSKTSKDISYKKMVEWFKEKNANKPFKELKELSVKKVKSSLNYYPDIHVNHMCMEEMFNYIESDSCDVQYFKGSSDLRMNIAMIVQHEKLKHYEWLFVDGISSLFQIEILEIIDYMLDVGLHTNNIIAVTGMLDPKLLGIIEHKIKEKPEKVVLVETPEIQHIKPERLNISHLTEKSREGFFNRVNDVNFFGTAISLQALLNDEDSLSYLSYVLHKVIKTKQYNEDNINKRMYEKIKSWYIPRSLISYSEKEATLTEDIIDWGISYGRNSDVSFDDLEFKSELANQMLESVMAGNGEESNNSVDLGDDSPKKNHIVLDDAGSGKSTYFTWLASSLSEKNSSWYVIRMNASRFCVDYQELQKRNFESLDDISRILYRFIHLTLFVSNENNNFDTERRKAVEAAKLIKFSDGKIQIDTGEAKKRNLSFDQYLELRVFQVKFNEKQLIILLDGLDETAPTYKDLVMKFCGKLAGLEGIHSLYISTRPMDEKAEMEKEIPSCNINRLKPFSTVDQLHFMNMYFKQHVEEYKNLDEKDQTKVLGFIYNRFWTTLADLRFVPLFLHMACATFAPNIKQQINFNDRYIKKTVSDDAIVDIVQPLKYFVEEKQNILFISKGNIKLDDMNKPNLKRKFFENERYQNQRIHTLLAVKTLFQNDNYCVLLTDEEKKEVDYYMKDVTNIAKLGIIKTIQEGFPQFTHHIFAEYFSAIYLYENKDRMKNESFFKSWSYWYGATNQSGLYRLRDLFNRIVLKEGGGSDIHMAVINQSYEEVYKLLSENPSAALKTDAVGRLPLHLAVTYPLSDIVNLLLNNKSVLQSMNRKDHLFGWNALDYAFASRYEKTTKMLLTAGVTVNEYILLEQILSNSLRQLLFGAHCYGQYLQSHEHSKAFTNTLYKRVAQHLLNKMCVDLFSRSSELDSLKIPEFCAKKNMIGLFKELVSQLDDPTKVTKKDIQHFLELACTNNAPDIIAHIVEEHNVPVSQIHNIAGLISATKHAIRNNRMSFFRTIFHQLCSKLEINVVEDTSISEDIPCGIDEDIPPLDKEYYPEVCCVRSSSNVQLPLPEYDEDDVLHEGYVIEALLAHAVHEGNTQILRYIVRTTETPITNNLILKIMRLLPKGEGVSHEKSVVAFKYLLDNTCDLTSADDEGRNLLHMTVQNGCFFMLHCLNAKGFDPSLINPVNGWSAFHYAAFNEDKHPSDSMLEYLLKHCNFIWFDDLHKFLSSEEREITNNTTSSLATPQNTPNVKKLSKQQYQLLACFSLLGKQYSTKLFSEQEHQEAIELIKTVAESKEKTAFIKGVQNDTPQFTHRIFAEYVAAKWMWENKTQVREKRFFLSWSYWYGATNQSGLYRLRDLFNRIVLKEGGGSDIHMAVINQSYEEVYKLLSENPSAALKTDAVGRLPLHLAVTYPLSDIVNLLLNNKSVLQSMNRKDHLFGWNALDYAFASRYEKTTKMLLTAGVTVNEYILLEQILSNSLRQLLFGAHCYGQYLQSHEHSKAFTNTLYKRVAQHLLNKMCVDLFSRSSELDSLKIPEFCAKKNMIGLFKELVSQLDDPTKVTKKDIQHFLELACTNNAPDIIAHIVEEHNVPVSQIHNIAGLISATKHAIRNNRMSFFRTIFHQLCSKLEINVVEDTSISEDIPCGIDEDIPPLDMEYYPEVCCVRSSSNVQLPLPEYDEDDVLHEGYVIEALLAHAVHEGNTQILRYIVRTTETPITNNLILKIMRLLPKGEGVSHEKSVVAFKYLLDNTCDLTSADDEGRNLLHMTVQNGCFFMLHCLNAKGFDPSLINPVNGWSAFHYAAFNEDKHPSDSMLEYLLKHCNFIWFDDLHKFLSSEEREITNNTTSSLATPQNTPNVKKLSKQQYQLLACFSLLGKQYSTKLFSEQEHQEAIELIKTVAESKEKTAFIKGVQNDTPQFTHRIFAEYVAAKWMWENKTQVREKRFFLSWSYWYGAANQSGLYRLRDLFNRIVLKESGGSDIHMAVIKQSYEEVQKLLIHNSSAALKTDDVGRLPLHLAVTYPSSDIVNLLLNNKSVRQSINRKDHLFGWTALDYAFANRYEVYTNMLLEAGATVNDQLLFEHILSNSLRQLLFGAQLYGKWLQAHEHSKAFASSLYQRVAQHLLDKKHDDLFSHSSELDSLTILEFCAKENMIGVFKHLMSRLHGPTKVTKKDIQHFLELALMNNAPDIIAHIIEEHNVPVTQIHNIAGLISATKHAIRNNRMSFFRTMFLQLCFQLGIPVFEDTLISEDNLCRNDNDIPPLDKEYYPKVCCVRSSSNVRLPMPEYDENDVLHEGYVIEALLAHAVHEGNIQILRYIVRTTETPITNNLIVKIMRLLPKGVGVSHEKSVVAFKYLLDNTSDLTSADDEGRNFFHMTVQNGCFYMLHCLIAKGFDPSLINPANGWSAFHYAAFNEDEHPSDSMLEYLLKHGNFIWFDDLHKFLSWEENELTNNASSSLATHQNTPNVKKLSKQQYQLLACFSLLGKQYSTKLFSEQEHQEAIELIKTVAESKEKIAFITGVQTDTPQFTHRILAEYMVAQWMTENKNHVKEKDFFRSWAYWNGGLYRMRDLFNRIVLKESGGSDIHMAVINQSYEEVYKLMTQNPLAALETDAVGRLPLHLAVTYPSSDIVNLLLNNKSVLESINRKDHLFEWTALDHAFANSYIRYQHMLLAAGATVNEQILFEQIVSNSLRQLLFGAKWFGELFQAHEHFKAFASTLYQRVAQYLLNEICVDPFSLSNELDSLTILEFCAKMNMIGVFKQLVSQLDDPTKVATEDIQHFLALACTNNSPDIIAHIVEEHNAPVTQIHNIAGLISATKHAIRNNRMSFFRTMFHQLCSQLEINVVENADILEDILCRNDKDIPPQDMEYYPKVCCVRSSSNVRLPLPEYDGNDLLHEGYVIEALLAHAVHEGNTQILRYIVRTTETPITNNLIVKIMTLLPKGKGVSHEKSVVAFKYLLDNTSDLTSADDEGRNLLHMTVQNGCFFMLNCLIAKGFDPSLINPANGWSAFHYTACNEGEHPSDSMLEYLLKHGNFIWFDDLHKFLSWEENELTNNASSSLATPQNTPNVKKLSKQQYQLLACFSLLGKQYSTKLFSEQEHQEAIELIKTVAESKEKIAFITGVQTDTPQFTHRILAEYMVAQWMTENKNHVKEKDFFRSWAYWNGGLYRMRDLFNRIVLKESGGSDIHMAVINQSHEEVEKLLIQNPSAAVEADTVGRLPLHLAVTYPSSDIVNLLLNNKSVLQSMNRKDHLFGWSALDYAFANRYEVKTKMLLAAGATVDEQILLEQILSNSLRQLLFGAQMYGEWLQSHEQSTAFASTLYKRVAQHLLNEMCVDPFSPNNELDSLTILEFCAIENIIGVFNQILCQGNFETKYLTENYARLFNLASEHNAHDIIDYLEHQRTSQ